MNKQEKLTIGEKIANKNRVFKMIYLFGDQLKQDNVSSYAASCAFFFFMSLIPMVMLVCAVLPFTPLKEEDLINILTSNLPEITSGFLVSLVSEVYAKSVGVLSVAIVATLWSAGKGVNALIMGLNAIEHIRIKTNGIVMRIFASLYTLVFLASIVIFLVLVVYGNTAVDMLVYDYPKLADVYAILVNFRMFITILLMTVVFMILYAELPSHRMKIRMQFVGAVFTSVTWTIFSYFFSLYVENYNAFTMYGSMATIIILLFWLYACMYLVFIGANLNKYLRPLVMVTDQRLKDRSKRGQSESLEE